ncbi:MAG: HD domain-containing protein [Candidatus Aenigmarchaeota archaeon]|nr:HD domain-containing protein [Candidatus Aenigmarchaeota archaeon]
MKANITIDEAKTLLHKYIKEEFLLNHSRETEVIMRGLAKHFKEDEDFWGITGLLHDLDMDDIGTDIQKHGERTCQILEQEGYEIPKMFDAIKSHTEALGHLGIKRKNKLDFALSAAENITGIIYAYVLMRPDKTIDGVKTKSITKKIKDKTFASNVNREAINDIEKTGLSRGEFIEIALDSMKSIAEEIGM